MLILTILGVSGMNTATLELTMAANSQARQVAFQAAESAIEIAMTGPIDTNAHYAHATHLLGDGSVEVDTELRCVEVTRVPDDAHGEDLNAHAVHFEVTAVGRGPRNSVSRLTQGFYIVVSAATLSNSDAEESADGDCLTQTMCLGLECIADPKPGLPIRTYWRQDDIDD